MPHRKKSPARVVGHVVACSLILIGLLGGLVPLTDAWLGNNESDWHGIGGVLEKAESLWALVKEEFVLTLGLPAGLLILFILWLRPLQNRQRHGRQRGHDEVSRLR